MIYVIMLVLLYIIRLLLKLSWFSTAVLLLYFVAAISYHRRLHREQKKQEIRFRDASIYMDTLLYAFAKEGKILRAFEDVEATLRNGELKMLVREALEHMLMTFDETEVLADSLAIIEKKYKCSRIMNIHNFMVHVEYYGGDVEQSVDLLLEDKCRWERRISGAREERKQMFIQILLSVIASILICGVILYLPVMSVDISKNIVVQILGVLVVVIDDFIIIRAQKKLCEDWLVLDVLDEEEYYQKKMKAYREYDLRKDLRLSAILSIIPIILCGTAVYLGNKWLVAASLILLLIFANQHKIGRALSRKSLTKYISSAFPRWLMDIGLLLQSENVHMALMKSRAQVPRVLYQELEELIGRIQINPEEAEPYYMFLKDFDLPEVHSAMGMLYGIYMGNSGNSQKQIGELISRNQELLEAADRERLHNKNSSMYLLFLAPVLTGSFKLVIDMAIFLLMFLSVKVV